MGVDLGELITKRKITFQEIVGKSIAIDAYNSLYQFLAIIRGASGEPLMDRRGRITSHLSGLFYRNSNLLELGIKPLYVFDGKPPLEKEIEIKRRRHAREEAVIKYEKALKEGDLVAARTYAQAAVTLKDELVEDAKRLLTLMGIPWIQAPSEGEAQAAFMVARGDVWAVGSQDHDSLLFGAPRLIRNLTISGRRKLPGRNLYVEITPEFIDLNETLKNLSITREQLIDIGILIGTDFNPDGVKGIGPKKALGLIREYGSLEKILPLLKGASFPTPIEGIRKIFLSPKVTEDYSLEWREPDIEGTKAFLCEERDFSPERVEKALKAILEARKKFDRKPSLTKWF